MSSMLEETKNKGIHMSMPEETKEHTDEKPKPQPAITRSPTMAGSGLFRSESLRDDDKRFQHFTADCFTNIVRRTKSDLTLKMEHNIIRKWCIYRVPSKLRNVNAAVYTPQLLSISLFHYGKPKLKDMERHKQIYSDSFCKRSWEGKGKLSPAEKASDLRNFIKLSQRRILDCYAGTIDLKINKDRVVEIILVDACFIIELFLRNSEVEYNDKDYILSSLWLRKAIELELILFENQLPFSLLQDLYDQVFPASSNSLPQQAHEEIGIDIDGIGPKPVQAAVHPFLALSCEFFKDFSTRKPVKDGVEPKHFTDLVRYFMLPHLEKVKWEKTAKSTHSIRMLTAAGVNFMPAGEHHEPLVVKIDDPQAPERVTEKEASKLKSNRCFCSLSACSPSMNLKLTPFYVKDDTECIIRNIMALEQFLYPKEAYVCNYFLIMDKLVDTVEDVDFLVENGVIVNMLGSNKEVAKLINKLCDHIMEENSCYNHICEKLNMRYKNSLYRHWVSLGRVYFKDLWTGSATVFGVVLVLLTIVEIAMSFRK